MRKGMKRKNSLTATFFLSEEQWQEYSSMISERDTLAARIPWAINAALQGLVVMVISGILLRVRFEA